MGERHRQFHQPQGGCVRVSGHLASDRFLRSRPCGTQPRWGWAGGVGRFSRGSGVPPQPRAGGRNPVGIPCGFPAAHARARCARRLKSPPGSMGQAPDHARSPPYFISAFDPACRPSPCGAVAALRSMSLIPLHPAFQLLFPSGSPRRRGRRPQPIRHSFIHHWWIRGFHQRGQGEGELTPTGSDRRSLHGRPETGLNRRRM